MEKLDLLESQFVIRLSQRFIFKSLNSQFQPCFEVICAAFSVICFAAILLFLSLASSAGVSPIALLFGRFTIASIELDRQLPSLDEATVIGVLQAGDPVRLTGWVAQGDGVTWVEAIAPHQPPPHQVGWTAACFLAQ